MAEADDKNLPSIEDFLPKVDEELPSVEDYLEEEVENILVEENEETEDSIEEEVERPVDLTEVLHLINKVREDIPNIPEIKYYDSELERICEIIDEVKESIPTIPEVKYYDQEIEVICDQIDQVREFITTKINDLPEVKYYDEQVQNIEDRIDTVIQEVANLPEPKYYESDILSIREDIDNVRNSIPKFPKWVNEVNEVPDFSWIGKTFSVIDDDFIKVNDTINTLEENLNIELKKLLEENEVKHFENRVQFGTEVKDLDKKIGEEKDKIWKELRETSLRIWEYHHEFKDDDRKLKKQIKGDYNKLKENLNQKLEGFNLDSQKTDELLLKYFTDLREEVENLPEVKYYDDEIKNLREDFIDLRVLVKTIREEQQSLIEGLLNEPPSEKESVGNQVDPLTPMDQNFATLEDLEKHYRLFINRIQQQISTIGGGGAGFIKDLDDVTFDAGIGTNKLLIYNGNKWVGIASTALSGAPSQLAETCTGTNLTVTNLSVTGIATYEDVKNVDSLGFSTFRSGLEVRTGTATTALLVQGDARVTGILTVGTASITIDPNAKQIKGIDEIIIGTATTVAIKQDSSGQIKFEDRDGKETSVGIGTTVSINTTGIITASTIRASSALYPPLYTTVQRDAGTFSAGAIIFNSTTSKLEFYDGTTWQSLPGMTLGLTVALDG